MKIHTFIYYPSMRREKVKSRFDELTFVAKCRIRNLLMVPQHTSVRDQSNLMSDVIVFLSNFEVPFLVCI